MMLLRKDKKRVLVADDDEDVLEVLRAILEFGGYKVDTAKDGEEAWKEIKRHRYDLLVLDIIMPRIDGLKLFRALRKSEKYQDVPVLFISGYPVWTQLEERRRQIVEQANAVIQKPFNTKEFLETVRRLSERQERTTQ